MDKLFLSNVPNTKGTTIIQKLFASDTILSTINSFNQYALLKVSDNAKVLCKLVPLPISTNTFASCDPSVVKYSPSKLINPSTLKLNVFINKENIEPIDVFNANRMVVSVVFKDVDHQCKWSKDISRLSKVVHNLLRLFIVHNDCIVNLKRLRLKQYFNIDFIIIHKTDCKNNGARITNKTTIMILKTMSTEQYDHVEIGLKVLPLFGIESQANCLKNIIKAARNGCTPICNMVGYFIFIM